jgi:WD40 repeat protein
VSGFAKPFAVDPHGLIFATGYDVDRGLHGYGHVDLWRTIDSSKVATIETKASVLGVSLSASGYLATWSNGGFVKIWNVDDNSVVRTIQIAKGTPTQMIWSPSEASIVVAANTGEIYVFDAKSGEQRFCRDSHGNTMFGIYALGFSSDESWFASKGGDGKVLLWGTTDWLPFGVFEPWTANWRLKGPLFWRSSRTNRCCSRKTRTVVDSRSGIFATGHSRPSRARSRQRRRNPTESKLGVPRRRDPRRKAAPTKHS